MYSDSESMQGGKGDDGSLLPSPAAASSFTSHLALAPCQTPLSSNRGGNRALSSLWIRRLQPQDESEAINAEKVSSIGMKHHTVSREKEINVVAKQQSMCEQGRERVFTSHIPSDSGGFKQIQGATCEKPIISVANCRYTSEALQFSSRAVGGRLHGVQAEGSTFSGRPPLPRMHGRCEFVPKDPGYTSQSSASSSACKITTSAADGGILAMAPRITSLASKETLVTEYKPTGPLLKERHDVQNAFDRGFSVTKEIEVTRSEKIGGTQATSTLNLPKRFGPNQDSRVVAMTLLENPRLKNLNGLKNAEAGGVKVQSAQRGGQPMGSFLTERLSSKPAADCSGRSPKANETLQAASTASNTATFPWEMFAEAGGPSRNARQEFVEVYNRARNELKNQKASSLFTKVSDNDVESRPGLASRGATYAQSTSTSMHGRQNIEGGSQLKMLEKLKQISQPDVPLTRQPSMSFLAGEDTKKSSQAYGGVHVAVGKDCSSIQHGQPGGAFHFYAKPLSVAPRDRIMTSGESSDSRPGFASSRGPDQCNKKFFAHKDLLKPTLSSETDLKMPDVKAPMLLSERQAGHLDGNLTIVTGKEPVKHRENSPRRSEAWIQRWYPTQRNSHEHKPLKLQRRELDLAGRLDTSMQAAQRDNYAGYGEERDFKKRLIENGSFLQKATVETTDWEGLKPSSGRAPPSAAAMAIVGTTAHQFCSMQPQSKKDSFPFWAGFGMPAPQASKSSAERGQKRYPSRFEPSS